MTIIFEARNWTESAPRGSEEKAALSLIKGKSMPWDEFISSFSSVPSEWLYLWRDSSAHFDVDNFIESKVPIILSFVGVTKPNNRIINSFCSKMIMKTQFAYADTEQFSDRNKPFAFLFLLCGIDGDTVASWNEIEMSKIMPLVLKGYPLDSLLMAYHNDVDLSLISGLC